MPINCNDVDLTETSVIPRPMEVPTDASAQICRAEAFRIFRQIYDKGGAYLSSYAYIQSVDQEIQALIARFPWYFRIGSNESLQHLPTLDKIAWQHECLHMSICLQRIRMNRPFLHARIGESWRVCFQAARELLAPYRRMRELDPDRFRRSQKFAVQGYQAYAAAVTIAAFLLVERSLPDFSSEYMRQDVDMVISDLQLQDLGPLVADGIKILQKMLHMIDHRGREHSGTKDPQTRESLVRDIAPVFGGEQPTRSYLKQTGDGGGGSSSIDSISSSNMSTTTTSTGRTENSRDSVESALTVPSPSLISTTADPSPIAAHHPHQHPAHPAGQIRPEWTGIQQYASSVTIPTAIEQIHHHHHQEHPPPHTSHHDDRLTHHHHHHHHPYDAGDQNEIQATATATTSIRPSIYADAAANSNRIDFMTDDNLQLALDMMAPWPMDMPFPETSFLV